MKKSFILLVYIITQLLSSWQLTAQEKNSFSLQEAIDYALKHNISVKNADLNIKEAKWKKWETIATGLPQINAKAEYQNNVLLPDEFNSSDRGEGGMPNILSFIFPKQQISPSITLTQLIFNGTYLVGLQSSKVFLEISKNAKIKTNKEITKAVTSAYSNVLLTKESISIMEKNSYNLKQNINETKALWKNGLTEEENLEQLEITLNNLENNKTKLTQMYDVSVSMLKYLMGVQESTKIEVTDSLDSLSIQNSDTENNTFSILQNIDFKIAENNVEAQRLLYKAEQARQLPSIAGFASLGTQGFAQEFNEFNKNQWFTVGTVGLSVEIPVFTSFQGKARRIQAKLNWEEASNELIDVKTKTLLDVKRTNIDLNLSKSTLENKKRNLLLSEKIENKNRIKYKEGIASSFELRQAQEQLYRSQQEYLQAMVDLINKKAELESLTK